MKATRIVYALGLLVAIAFTSGLAGGSSRQAQAQLAAPNLTLEKTGAASVPLGATSSFTITVGNNGDAATTGLVTVRDSVPTGLTDLTAGGTGWSCTIVAQDVTCTRSDSLPAADSYDVITIGFKAGVCGSKLNRATVSGGGDGGFDPDASDSFITDVPCPNLTLDKTGPTSIPAGSLVSFDLTVGNSGPGSTFGPVTLTDALPAGSTGISAGGTGWSCSVGGFNVECTRSDTLAAAAAFDPVEVAFTSPGVCAAMENNARASGGGDTGTDPDASDKVLTTLTCAGPTGKLEVRKQALPADGPGRFNLQIDGATYVLNGPAGSTTGERLVPAGIHAVGETAGAATSLGDYISSISCRASNGAGEVVAGAAGPGPIALEVTEGSDIVCIITNVAASLVPAQCAAMTFDNIILSGGLNTIIVGTPQDDLIIRQRVGGGVDRIFAGAGDDCIVAGDANDFVAAGPGNDVVLGGSGNDLLIGGTGSDTLIGESGTDWLLGDAGDSCDGEIKLGCPAAP